MWRSLWGARQPHSSESLWTLSLEPLCGQEQSGPGSQHGEATCVTLFLGTHEPTFIHPREWSNDTTKLQYHQSPDWWTNEFIRISYRSMATGCLQGHRWQKDNCVRWKPALTQRTTHESWNTGVLITTYRQFYRWESLLLSSEALTVNTISAGEGLYESGKFQELPETCGWFPSWVLRNLPTG